MRTRLRLFVTTLGAILAVACGNSNGGGGGGVIYCGVGGACPPGFSCNATNYCTPSGADASGSDGQGKSDVEGKGDGTSGATDAQASDDAATVDSQFDTSKPDTFKLDTSTPDVQSGTQTVSAIQQAGTSASCTTLTSSTDTESNVSLEPVVVTSPATSLKGSGSTYFTTFFVESQNAATDGSWAGIQVIVTASPFTVNVGDVLNITGTIKEFYCMTEMSAAPADVVITGNVGETAPHGLQVSVFANDASAEAFEGDLVKITNVQVGDPNPLATDGKTHGECTINHNGGATTVLYAPAIGSAYLGTSGNGATTTFSAGQGFASITGNLEWSFGQWLIRARSDADIVLK